MRCRETKQDMSAALWGTEDSESLNAAPLSYIIFRLAMAIRLPKK